MILRQLLDEAGGCASYLVGCELDGRGCVVDPLAAVGAEEYLLLAAEHGLEVAHVCDTHLHADHVSAARELAALAGAELHLYAGAPVDYPFAPLRDGDELVLGTVRLRVLHTPGHTEESYSLLVFDRLRAAAEPWCVLTGDWLLPGDVARPDLTLSAPDPEAVRRRATALYDSLHGRLLALPDWVSVYPGHYGASPCGGRNLSPTPASTVGFERRHNAALLRGEREDFVGFVLQTLRPEPADYRAVKRGNAAAREVPAPPPPDPVRDDLLLVDLRPERAFLRAHVPGSVHLPFLRPFERPRRPFAAVAQNGVVARAAGAAAWFRLSDWEAAGRPVDRVAEVAVEALPPGARLVDVRQPEEWADGIIPGAVLLPEERLPGDLDPAAPCVLYCATGIRSAELARRLRAAGFRDVSTLAGGVAAWRLGGRELAEG